VNISIRIDQVMRPVFSALGLTWMPTHPRGKGVFVRSLGHGGKTDDEVLATLRRMGLRWVMLMGESFSGQAVSVPRQRYSELVPRLRAAGIEPWLWGWIEPGTVDRFTLEVGGLARDLGIHGICIDVEGPWVTHRAKLPLPELENRAEDCVAALRRHVAAVGFTSFPGGPQFFGSKNFPWRGFARACDWGMPQLYGQDPQDVIPQSEQIPTARQMVDWQRSWLELLDGRMIPVLGGLPNSAHLKITFDRAELPLSACAWWDLAHLAPNKVDTIGSFVVHRRKGEAIA